MKVLGGLRLAWSTRRENKVAQLILTLLVASSIGDVQATSVAEIRYIHLDHLGTVQAVTDQDGDLVSDRAQLPFGSSVINPRTTAISFRFPGQQHDEETGLHYNLNRYYDPETGRYLTGDPIGMTGGVNLYIYASANPIRYSDPTGLIHEGTPCLIPGECECATAECAARILPNPTNPCVETCLVRRQMVEPMAPGTWSKQARKAYPWQLRAGITITKYLATIRECNLECESKETQSIGALCSPEPAR